MLEKDHFKNSTCIYSKVKSKADYSEIRFLSFTAVTPAGCLGLCMSEQGGSKEASLSVGAPLACLPASPHQPSHWAQGGWPWLAVLPLLTSWALGAPPCTPEPAGWVAPSLLKTRWGLQWNKSPTLYLETISASTLQCLNYMRLKLFPMTSTYQVSNVFIGCFTDSNFPWNPNRSVGYCYFLPNQLHQFWTVFIKVKQDLKEVCVPWPYLYLCSGLTWDRHRKCPWNKFLGVPCLQKASFPRDSEFFNSGYHSFSR